MTASADPNFEAHLSSMLKRGAAERPPPEMGSDLRKTFKKSIVASRRSNRSSPERDELNDDISETNSKFASLAARHDDAARGVRSSPDLGSQLRQIEQAKSDPNFESHVAGFMKKGLETSRPDADLPHILRKQSGRRFKTSNPVVTEELEEIEVEIAEAHEQFAVAASQIKAKKYFKNGVMARSTTTVPVVVEELEEIAVEVAEAHESFEVAASKIKNKKFFKNGVIQRP